MIRGLLSWLYENDVEMIPYYAFHVLGFLATIFLVKNNATKMELSPKKAVWTVIIVYPLLYVWNYVLYWIESGFRIFGGNNIVRLFVYLPLFLYPASKVNKIPYTRLCQLIAPVPCLTQSISHLGCVFAGCCRGYSCSWGVYNPYLQQRCFPSQWLESLVAFSIVVMLQKRNEKRRWQEDGEAMPLMLLAFGSTRFLLEFFRDNTKLFWGISALALHAAFCAAVGGVWLWKLRKKNAVA